MLKCLIIDDEEHAIKLLTQYIERTPYLTLDFASTNAIEAVSYINEHPLDIIFSDIHMDDLSGMQLVKLVKTKAKIILTTAYSDYTLDAFEEGVFDYLLKPISYERFLKATQKVIKITEETINTIQVSSNSDDSIFVRLENKGKMTRILLEDILYIEGMNNYLAIQTKTESILTLLTFKELEESLHEPRFIRVHKSFTVAFNKITGIDANELIVQNNTKKIKIPIGRSYKDKLLEVIHPLLLGK